MATTGKRGNPGTDLTDNHNKVFMDQMDDDATELTAATTSSAANTVKTDIITMAVAGTGTIIKLAEPTGGGASVVSLEAPALGGDRAITIPDADVTLANIAVNTTHVTGDGSDHADVADSTADITAVSVGTAGTNVTAVEYGGKQHTTVLTLTDVVLGAPTAGGNSAHGSVIYTFPAGVHTETHIYFSVGLTIGTVTTDIPDVGIGSVIGAGAIALLNGTTMEDYVTAITWNTALDGTARVQATIPATAGLYTGIANNAAADVKEVHFNVADGWAAGVTGNLTASGTVIIVWNTIA